MFVSGIRNSRILSGGIWNPGFWNPKLQLKETGIALTIGIRNPSSINKEAEIQNSRLSSIRRHRANKYRVFLKNHSDTRKKSNWDKEWDKENVSALKHHATNLLYGRSRLRAKSVTKFTDMRPVYCLDELKNVLRVVVRENRAKCSKCQRKGVNRISSY